MSPSKKHSDTDDLLGMARWTMLAFILVIITVVFALREDKEESKASLKIDKPSVKNLKMEDPFLAEVEDGIHIPSGLAYGAGFDEVYTSCLACHSAKLITQNRAIRAGWEEMIRWMQATQGLGDLTGKEDAILDYLAEHYAPEEVARRSNLDIEAIEWYVLD